MDSLSVGWFSHGRCCILPPEVNVMDQEKIGKYIASLRRQAGLTQESLGKKLGVTNKTISRWENGNYMPDVGMLPPLARELNVSINELLAGEKISDDAFQKKPDGTILEAATVSAFSFEERKAYFKKMAQGTHISLYNSWVHPDCGSCIAVCSQ